MQQSPRKASDGFYKLSAAAARHFGPHDDESLLIGTHTNIPFAGSAMLSERFSENHREIVVDSPKDVLARLRILAQHNVQQFACVIAAFELHHFDRRDMQDVLELAQLLSHGVVLTGDYAYRGLAPETVQPHAQSGMERLQQKIYGSYDAWFKSHAIFRPDDLDEEIREPGWKSIETFRFANNQVGAIGSMTMSSADLQTIVTSASLDSAHAHS